MDSLLHQFTFLISLKNSIIEANDDFLTKRQEMIKEIKGNLYKAQNILVQTANRKHSERVLIFFYIKCRT